MNITNSSAYGMQDDALEGITCDVTNCYYNEQGHICTAHKIQVGPQYAASSADTVCATFKPRS